MFDVDIVKWFGMSQVVTGAQYYSALLVMGMLSEGWRDYLETEAISMRQERSQAQAHEGLVKLSEFYHLTIIVAKLSVRILHVHLTFLYHFIKY